MHTGIQMKYASKWTDAQRKWGKCFHCSISEAKISILSIVLFYCGHQFTICFKCWEFGIVCFDFISTFK